MEEIRRHPDGSINCEYYARRAREHRSAHIRHTLSVAQLASASPVTRRGFKLFAAALVVATGAFWATILTSPPTTEAGSSLAAGPGAPVELFSVSLTKAAPGVPSGAGYDTH
jgi:hypothetical protein